MSIEVKQGVVGLVYLKELDAPDQFGNLYRRSFKLEGDDNWYDVGGGKYNKITVKVGKEFRDLAVGDQIVFTSESRVYKEKTYYKVSTAKITFTSAPGAAPARPAPQRGNPASPPRSGATPPAKATSQEAGIVSGMALNNAVQVSIHQGDVTDANIYANAERIIRLATKLRENFDDIRANKPAVQTPTPDQIEQANQEAAAAAADDFDDDIPF